jgi:molybdopterin molybdotransferase
MPARRGEALRVYAGAPLPDGPDTVLLQDDCLSDADDRTLSHVLIPPVAGRGANYHKPGEDVRPGTVILTAGRRLRPQDIGLVALLGRDRLTVYRRLRVALFSIGDGVREPGTGPRVPAAAVVPEAPPARRAA